VDVGQVSSKVQGMGCVHHAGESFKGRYALDWICVFWGIWQWLGSEGVISDCFLGLACYLFCEIWEGAVCLPNGGVIMGDWKPKACR